MCTVGKKKRVSRKYARKQPETKNALFFLLKEWVVIRRKFVESHLTTARLRVVLGVRHVQRVFPRRFGVEVLGLQVLGGGFLRRPRRRCGAHVEVRRGVDHAFSVRGSVGVRESRERRNRRHGRLRRQQRSVRVHRSRLRRKKGKQRCRRGLDWEGRGGEGRGGSVTL